MACRLGADAKLYYSATLATSTTYTVPATIANAVREVKTSSSDDTPDITTRENLGVKQYAYGERDLSITFLIKCPAVGATDAAYTAFRDAHKNKTIIAAYALTGASNVAGSEGPAGNFIVSKFEIDQANGNGLFASVELKPDSFNGWHTAAGS